MPADQGPQPPTGEAWLHEIKHDGFRVVARKDGDRVRLYSRPTQDLMSSPKLPWKRNMPISVRANGAVAAGTLLKN
jgi:bifunctional non-homologous end joining protein LigD